jgi:glyoxylase-like metal-dependent hydrolase (beta-lactamase superfamily II)
MNVQRLVLGELDTNAWLVDDGDGGPLIVIDPAGDAAELLAAIAERPVAAVVLTHGHFDHLGAAEAVVHLTSAPLMVHAADADAITTAVGTGAAMFGYTHAAPEADRLLADGDVVEAGGVSLIVIHTPGHTPGSISLLASEAGELFSGDTLFAGSIGRTDFPGGDHAAMIRSLARLATLPAETRVHPGHGPDTTIGREERVNPFWPRA